MKYHSSNTISISLGQEDGGEELVKTYPTMQEIGEDLVNILDVMRVKVVVGLAEGAGANALLRFGSMHVRRCLSIVCINPNSATATMIGRFLVRTKVINISKLASPWCVFLGININY